MTEHTPIHPAPSLNAIVRRRLAALIARQGTGAAAAARAAGWSESTLYRRLHNDPADQANYRRLHVCDADQLLQGLGLSPDDLLQPVLLPGDRELLVWVGERTPSDPLPSRAVYMALEAEQRHRVYQLEQQGLLVVCGPDTEDPDSWYVRLTAAGQRALR